MTTYQFESVRGDISSCKGTASLYFSVILLLFEAICRGTPHLKTSRLEDDLFSGEESSMCMLMVDSQSS